MGERGRAYLAAEVAELVGNSWIERQRNGDGWLLCGGRRAVTAVVWVDTDAGSRLLVAAGSAEGAAMGSFLMETAPALGQFAVPPLR